MRAYNGTTGHELAANLTVAASLFSRAKGLLGRPSLPEGEGLLIRPCKGVHTCFMKFAIDVVFLDKENRVIDTLQHLQPYRFTRMVLSCSSVLELPAGMVPASKTVAGNEVVFD